MCRALFVCANYMQFYKWKMAENEMQTINRDILRKKTLWKMSKDQTFRNDEPDSSEIHCNMCAFYWKMEVSYKCHEVKSTYKIELKLSQKAPVARKSWVIFQTHLLWLLKRKPKRAILSRSEREPRANETILYLRNYLRIFIYSQYVSYVE